jgi:nuclear pore complex protein Nup107
VLLYLKGNVFFFFSILRSFQLKQNISRPAADHAFHFSQLYIILNRASQLLEAFALGLTDDSYRRDTIE